MAGIVAPLEPGDHIGVFRINIDYFPFPFVTPLGADHNHVCHSEDSPIVLKCYQKRRHSRVGGNPEGVKLPTVNGSPFSWD
jgi:hypothetical protein